MLYDQRTLTLNLLLTQSKVLCRYKLNCENSFRPSLCSLEQDLKYYLSHFNRHIARASTGTCNWHMHHLCASYSTVSICKIGYDKMFPTCFLCAALFLHLCKRYCSSGIRWHLFIHMVFWYVCYAAYWDWAWARHRRLWAYGYTLTCTITVTGLTKITGFDCLLACVWGNYMPTSLIILITWWGITPANNKSIVDFLLCEEHAGRWMTVNKVLSLPSQHGIFVMYFSAWLSKWQSGV